MCAIFIQKFVNNLLIQYVVNLLIIIYLIFNENRVNIDFMKIIHEKK